MRPDGREEFAEIREASEQVASGPIDGASP